MVTLAILFIMLSSLGTEVLWMLATFNLKDKHSKKQDKQTADKKTM